MDATEIAGLESELINFLAEFDDCFGRSEPSRSCTARRLHPDGVMPCDAQSFPPQTKQ